MTDDQLEEIVADVLERLEPTIRRLVKRLYSDGHAAGRAERDTRRTSDKHGVCVYREGGLDLGYQAYYSNGTRQFKKVFRFTLYGDKAQAEAKKWRAKQLKRLRSTQG